MELNNLVKNNKKKTNKLVKSAIQVEDTENYNAHPYQKQTLSYRGTRRNITRSFLE